MRDSNPRSGLEEDALAKAPRRKGKVDITFFSLYQNGFGPSLVNFQTKNNLGKFWRVLQWKMLVKLYGYLVYFMAI
jgi:hypothetical protein